jgi:hypothetical protein
MNCTRADVSLSTVTPLATAEPAVALHSPEAPGRNDNVHSEGRLTIAQTIKQLEERKIKLPPDTLPADQFDTFVDFLHANRVTYSLYQQTIYPALTLYNLIATRRTMHL